MWSWRSCSIVKNFIFTVTLCAEKSQYFRLPNSTDTFNHISIMSVYSEAGGYIFCFIRNTSFETISVMDLADWNTCPVGGDWKRGN